MSTLWSIFPRGFICASFSEQSRQSSGRTGWRWTHTRRSGPCTWSAPATGQIPVLQPRNMIDSADRVSGQGVLRVVDTGRARAWDAVLRSIGAHDFYHTADY